nr:hypothetical protein [Paucibacter sp. B51]
MTRRTSACADVQGAPSDHHAAVCLQGDSSAWTFIECSCLGDARVVDHRLRQPARGPGRQVDQPSIGSYCAALFNQRIDGGLVDLEFDRAAQVQRDLGAGTHQHLAAGRLDAAAVADACRDQGDRTALGGLDQTLVDDGLAVAAFKAVAPGQKVLVVQVQGAGHQGADIDLGAGREQHAVRVQQENLTVGLESALDGRDLIAQHPIQGHGVAAGLKELDAVAGADIEAAPVGDQLGAALLHGQDLAPLADLGLAGHHLPAAGQRGGQGGPGHATGWTKQSQAQRTNQCSAGYRRAIRSKHGGMAALGGRAFHVVC